MIGWIILALAVAFAAVLCIRAARAGVGPQPKASGTPAASVAIDAATAVDHLAQMVRIPTVSSYDEATVDAAQFAAFRQLLHTLYPGVYACCEDLSERCGEKSILLRWKGKSSEAPVVLMSHFDVVPVEEEKWQHPPFCGQVWDGALWGRGTLDTKITLLGILESAETLAGEGFVPQNDLYFAFGGDEEVNGHGATDIIAWLRKSGVKPAMVLDEGGAVVEGVFPGVKAPVAAVGIGEKGFMNVELTARREGGHASQPVLPSTLGLLSRAIVRCENRPFRAHLTTPLREMLRTLTPHMPFGLRLVTANLWCFGGLLCLLAPKLGSELNAMMRTTMAFTMAKGSKQINVLPAEATAGLNLRLINLDTPQSVEAHLQRCIGDDAVTVHTKLSQPASPYAATEGSGWQALSQAISATWPGCIVTPYLMFACSDSRHYAGLCDNVYKFSAMALTGAQRRLIHNHDERIPVADIPRAVEFFLRLMRTL